MRRPFPPLRWGSLGGIGPHGCPGGGGCGTVPHQLRLPPLFSRPSSSVASIHSMGTCALARWYTCPPMWRAPARRGSGTRYPDAVGRLIPARSVVVHLTTYVVDSCAKAVLRATLHVRRLDLRGWRGGTSVRPCGGLLHVGRWYAHAFCYTARNLRGGAVERFMPPFYGRAPAP